MLALGLPFALWPMEILEIDLETRTFNVIRKEKRSAAGTLDSLGPLEVGMRSQVVGTDNDPRTIVPYVVLSAVHSKIDLYAMKAREKARQKMEALRARGVFPASPRAVRFVRPRPSTLLSASV